MGNERLLGRNAAIANMFTDSDQLKNYYRFIALNPHINLHDACNILLARPNATVCYPYEEWNELGRQVIRGKKSIAYYDYDGYKQFVFDVSDTRGDSQYNCSLMSREHLLVGLNELVGTDLLEASDSDYTSILKATKYYLNEQGIASEDELRSELLAEGIAYSLYSKTGLHQNEHIELQALPFSFKENAEFVKEVYVQAELLAQEIEDAYKNKQEEIKVLYDTEEETLSDDPKLPESTKTIVQTHSAIISNYKGCDVLLRWINPEKTDREAEVYLGKRENYDNRGHYDSFIPATQNIADWNANEELRGKTSAIIKNSQYTFIFKLSAPDMKDVLDVYRTGDSFNEEEQRMIISAVTGQAFFVGSTELRACVRIQASKYASELFDEEKRDKEEEEN